MEINVDINILMDKISHKYKGFVENFNQLNHANLEITVDINIVMDKIKILLHLHIPYNSNSTNIKYKGFVNNFMEIMIMDKIKTKICITKYRLKLISSIISSRIIKHNVHFTYLHSQFSLFRLYFRETS